MIGNDGNLLAHYQLGGDLLKTSLVFGVTLLLLFVLRRHSAWLRHLLAAAGLLLGASIPVLERMLPAVPVGIIQVEHGRAPQAHHPEYAPPGPVDAGPIASFRVPASAPQPSRTWRRPERLALGIWAFGFLVLLGLHVGSLLRVRLRTAEALQDSRIQGLADRVGRELAVKDGEVRIHRQVQVPLTWGFRYPRILLPEKATDWSEKRLRAVLVHEFLHARRRDYWTLWAAELVRCLYWCHPLAWWLASRVSVECELACDEAVVREGIRPTSYAGMLLAVARAACGPRERSSLAAVRRHGLADRVQRILDQRSRPRMEGTVAAALLILLGALTLAAAPWRAATKENLCSLDIRERQRAVWTLGEREDRTAVAELHQSLLDSSPDVRAVAAWSLGEIKDLQSLPVLAELLDDPVPYVREMAIRAIGEHESVPSLELLGSLLKTGVPDERAAAAWAIGQVPALESVALLVERSRDESPAVRAQVLESLSGFSLDALPDCAWQGLADDDPHVRAAACHFHGSQGDSISVDALLGALRDEDGRVRAAAAWALDEVNPSRS